jgi:hypothetical protein
VICKTGEGRYEVVVRLRAVTLTSALLLALVAVAPALATGYKGDVDYWGSFAATIVNNQVTALQGKSGGVPCGGGSEIDPVTFTLTAPVPVVDGKFHAQGTTLDVYKHTINWSLDASVSVTRTISGTVTISGPDPTQRTTCTKTFSVAAIIPPRNLPPRTNTNFTDATPPTAGTAAPQVNFDYRKGVVTHLSANAGTMCGQSVMGARLYTTASGLDPVQVNGGRFRIVADVLDDYDVVTHVVVSGRIKGKTASGTIDSSRNWDLNGTIVHCSQHLRWVARSGQTPSVGSSGGAYYEVDPYRYGRPGAWNYYLVVRPFACNNHVTSVRFHVVGGPTLSVHCNTMRKLGPLRPKQNYHVTATALHTRKRKVFSRTRLGDTFTYLPGDDAAWVPAPFVP